MKPALILLPNEIAQELIWEGLAKPNEIMERRGAGALQPIRVMLSQHGTDIVNLVGQGLISKAAVDPIYNAVARKITDWWQRHSNERLKLEAHWTGGHLSLELDTVDVDAVASFLREVLDDRPT